MLPLVRKAHCLVLSTALLLSACGKIPPALERDDLLSGTFSDQAGVIAHDFGIQRFTLSCDSNKKLKAKVEYLAPSGQNEELLDSKTPCTTDGVILTVEGEHDTTLYRVNARRAYDADLVMAEWRKTVAPIFGTLAYDEKLSKQIAPAYGSQLDDKQVSTIWMFCNNRTGRLHYQMAYFLESRPGRFPQDVFVDDDTPLECPNAPEVNRVLFQVRLASDSPSSATATKQRYRVLTTKAVDAGLAMRFMEEVTLATGRSRSF